MKSPEHLLNSLVKVSKAQSLGSSALDTAKSVGSSALDKAKSVGSSIKNTVTGGGAAPAPSGGGLGDTVSKYGKKALDYAKKNPGKTAAIGAGAGAGCYRLSKKLMDKGD